MNRQQSIVSSPAQLSIFEVENFTCDVFGTPALTKSTTQVLETATLPDLWNVEQALTSTQALVIEEDLQADEPVN